MPIETTSSRTGAMAFWIALAALAALALGAGTFFFARRSVERAATAELFFNPDAAYLDDSALTHSGQPAVAAAQSILTDAVVLDVLHQAGDSSANAAAATAEFRSDIEIKEPSLETLQLRYRDRDPRRAYTVANAVATALEEWAPPAPTRAASKPAAKAHLAAPAISAWQNPFRIARRASMPPRILAQPARLATGLSAMFLVAGAIGIFLHWRRETWTAHTADAVQGERASALIPSMSVAETALAREPVAVGPGAGQELVAAEPEAEREPVGAEPEAEWEPAAREPEGEWEPIETEPEAGRELVATEPESEWEPVAREPEGEWEPVETEFVQLAGEDLHAPLTFAPQISQEAEVAATPEPAVPAAIGEPPEAAAQAADELVPLDADTAKMAEAGQPEVQPGTLPEIAPEPGAASAQADEPSTDKADGMKDVHKSFVDPGGGDAEWSARILQALACTSMGQRPEAEHRGEP
jgi:hypothetical protein